MRAGGGRRARGRLASLLVGAAAAAALMPGGPAPVAGQGTPADERRAIERAERLREEGRPLEARRVLESVLDARPTSAEALGRLLVLLRDGGDVASLLPRAERAVERSDGADPELRGLWVRALLEAGRLDSARSVAGTWAARRPSDAGAHAWVARAAAAAGDTAAALAALERGLETAGEGAMLLAPLADLHVARGDVPSAVRAWVALLRAAADAPGLVAADLRALGPGGAAAREALWRALAAEPERVARERGAILALRVEAATAARELAAGALPDARAERTAFLRRYADEAGEAVLPGELSWAAERLIALSPRPIDRWRLRALSADMALAAGDTGRARDAFRRLADETRPGDGPHQVASRRLFGILASEPRSVEEAERAWEAYLRQYPDSVAALAEMAGELALGHARAGRLERAGEALARARTALGEEPGAGATLDAVEARLALFRGDAAGAVAALGRAAAVRTAGSAGERTRRLAWLAALDGADSAEVAHVGRGAFELHRDPAAFRLDRWLAGLDGTPAGRTRPALLAAFAGELAGAGRAEEAARLRERIARRHPDAPEAPAALLDLARGAVEGDPAAARDWLVQLITTYPESALAPLARRLLAELDERGPGA